MKIICIHDGHGAALSYFEDGEIKCLVQEERFTGRKNQGGFPEHSLSWLTDQCKVRLEEVDLVNIGCFDLPVYDWGTRNDFFHKLFTYVSALVPKQIISSNLLIKPYLAVVGIKRRRQLRDYSKKYHIPFGKLRQVEHHKSHGMAALFGSGFTQSEESVLVFTADGSGDGLSSSVAIWDKKRGYQRIHANQSFNSIGYLYTRITEYMGMKPGEHEYKVMGMAPYVSDKHSDPVLKRLLSDYLDLDETGLKMIYKGPRGMKALRKMKEDFFLERFDNVCAGAQRHFENIMLRWVGNWARETGVRVAVFGGGCFMNVKANMAISQLDVFDKLFFCPSAGDESTPIGAAYALYDEQTNFPATPLGHLYKGPEYSDTEIEAALEQYQGRVKFELSQDIEAKLAELIADYKIVARFKGRAEWGARALGNRSILCRADDLKMTHKLNKSIKMRDFWMPFASSILQEDAARYLVNPKNVCGSYMSVAFETHDLAARDLAAAVHPFDHTCRAQIVSEDWAPDYHRLLSIYKQKTGIGGVLNTSFNLHGKPVVGTPTDAIETLLNSEIEYLGLGNYLVWRS